jgi:lipoprotein-anchoring transpeptidase ErfK/SrfK
LKKIVLFLLPVILISFYSIGFSQDTKENEARYYIEISISECKLWLYQIENDYSRKLVKEYPVGTVKKGKRIFPVGKGVVTRKEYHPTWNPTEETRNEFAKRGVELPEVVPPGHPQNYMGSFKIYLSHFVPGKGDIYRIHGSRKEDEDKIGHRVSSGCIRMKNSDGEELARIIPVGTEVNIVL